MSYFDSVWDAGIPASSKPDLLAAISESFINTYLAAHRANDPEKYIFKQTYSGDGGASFSLAMAVNSPLRIELPPFDTKAGEKYVELIRFPKCPRSTTLDAAASTNNQTLKIFADDNKFDFSWTTKAGKSFSHTTDKVRFLLTVEIDLAFNDNNLSLTFDVLSLSVEKTALKGMKDILVKSNPTCDEKLDALFITLLQVIASQVSKKLTETVEIPVLHLGNIDLYPSILSFSNKNIVIAAVGDIRKLVAQVRSRMQMDLMSVREAFQKDIDNVGGIEALIFPARSLEKARSMDPQLATAFLIGAKVRPHKQITADLVFTNAVLAEITGRVTNISNQKKNSESIKKIAKDNPNVGVGVAENLIQKITSQSLDINQKNCTGELTLALIKGAACANVHVWNPSITINTNGLQGTVNMDIWAGLEYFWKRFWDCSWAWDGPHQIGLGLAGKPQLDLRTGAIASGLSIIANFDLSQVHLKTGINDLVDKIIAALDAPFIAVLQIILNAVATLLSLLIIPVRITVPGQATGLKFGNFSTSCYLRDNGSSRFLAVDSSATPYKSS
jgi:hypothetical protein